jgi:hypothetical protein
MFNTECDFFPICERRVKNGIRECSIQKEHCIFYRNFLECNSYLEDLAKRLPE